jgi:antitoxin VapB
LGFDRGLNIENPEIEWLAAEVASLARETKTETIHRALLERRARLRSHTRTSPERLGLRAHIERNAWPIVPPAELGRVLSREEEECTLGRSCGAPE